MNQPYKEIYILRHGETDYNKKGIVQGCFNTFLNVTGLKQAQVFFDAYKDAGFEIVYVSPLQRAQQTIDLFGKIDCPIILEESIKEMSFGKSEGKYPSKKMKREFAQLISSWKKGNLDSKITGGDSPNEIVERLKFFFNRLQETPQQKILLCSHGRTIKVMVCYLLGLPLTQMEEVITGNTGLHKILWYGNNNEQESEEENNKKTELVFTNNLRHLDLLYN